MVFNKKKPLYVIKSWCEVFYTNFFIFYFIEKITCINRNCYTFYIIYTKKLEEIQTICYDIMYPVYYMLFG